MPNNSDKYISEFWNYYHPPISNQSKASWLENTDNLYAFYRAFVPLYYRILTDATSSKIQNLNPLYQHKGWIVGDPHPANFGAIFTNNSSLKQSVIYTVNDSDDGFGDSPMFLDFLRFLTGVRIIDKNCYPVAKIRKAYLQGLKGKAIDDPPSPVKKCLKRLSKKEKCSKKYDYKRLYQDKKRKACSDIVEISDQQLARLKTSIKSEWQEYGLSIVKGFEYIRTKGGSGGLTRKVLLVRFTKRKRPARISKSKWLVLELKGLRQPSIQYLTEFSPRQVKYAQMQALSWQSRDKLSNLYKIIEDKSNHQYWLLRPRWVNDPVIDTKDFEDKQQRKKIYLYQARVLGNLHRQKAINPKAYGDDLKLIKAKHWKKAAKYMSKKLEEIWQNKDYICLD